MNEYFLTPLPEDLTGLSSEIQKSVEGLIDAAHRCIKRLEDRSDYHRNLAEKFKKRNLVDEASAHFRISAELTRGGNEFWLMDFERIRALTRNLKFLQKENHVDK